MTVVTGFTGVLLPRLLEGNLDIVIGSQLDDPLPAGIRFDPLFSANYCVVARQGHPLGNAKSFAQLADCEWILPTEMGRNTSQFHRVYRNLGIAGPKIRIHSDCPFFFLKMVASTDLVGLYRQYIMDQDVLPFPAALTSLSDFVIADRIGVFTRSQQSTSVTVVEFVENLRERAARLDQ
ncbi:hypothetical protein UP10_41165 [Bradyrhizobium sp. LTSPM299]|nr:hypothetical protein UP10_41165 [Bradyrhizobium sp. LTSPM299]